MKRKVLRILGWIYFSSGVFPIAYALVTGPGRIPYELPWTIPAIVIGWWLAHRK